MLYIWVIGGFVSSFQLLEDYETSRTDAKPPESPRTAIAVLDLCSSDRKTGVVRLEKGGIGC